MGCSSSRSVNNDSEIINPVKITILSFPGVGKTSLIEYLAGEYEPDLQPIETNGVVVRNINTCDHQFLMYDCGGRNDNKNEWRVCITNSDAVIYVFDTVSIQHGYIFTKEMIELTVPFVKKMNIPVLALLLKSNDEIAISRLGTLLNIYFVDLNLNFTHHSSLNDSVQESFSWLVAEIKKNVLNKHYEQTDTPKLFI